MKYDFLIVGAGLFGSVCAHELTKIGKQEKTIISKEYSSKWSVGDDPYYPVNNEINNNLYQKYEELSKSDSNIIFGGRLGRYKYYDMHVVVEEALKLVETL